MIKESILQEDIEILTICAPNNRTSKYVKQNLIQLIGEMDKPTVIKGKSDNLNRPTSIKVTKLIINSLSKRDKIKLFHW